MKFINKLTPVALATAMALGSLAAPMVAQAEVSSSASLASMYLWRGLDISDNKPAVSGDITYNHASGAYASLWLSSEGTFDNSYESDWTVGFSGEAAGVGYDVGYYKIWYPEMIDVSTGKPQTFADAAAEAYLGLSYQDFGFKWFTDAKSPKTYDYYTFSYGMGAFSVTVGVNDDDSDASDYKHLDLSYAATDRLSFTVSKKFALGTGSTLETNPIMMISYSLPVDLK